MTGSVQQKDKRYYAVISCKDASGKNKTKWIKLDCTNKSEGKKELKNIVYNMENNSFIDSSKITFTDFLKTWLHDVIYNNVEITTWESYKIVIERHVIPYFKERGNILLQKLQPI